MELDVQLEERNWDYEALNRRVARKRRSTANELRMKGMNKAEAKDVSLSPKSTLASQFN